MKSSEIIITAILYMQPGKLPIDIGAKPGSGISTMDYNILVSHFVRDDLPVNIYDVIQPLAKPDNAICVTILQPGRCFFNLRCRWKKSALKN